MRAQGERLGIFRVELLHDLGPEQAGGPHLGDFHEVVHADSPEERQPGRERVDAHACVHSRTQILQSVGQRVRQLDVGRRAGFLHMVARNGDRVEFRHVLRRVFEDVGDDLHREFGRVDIGVADHELLEDVVLDRAAQLLERATLLQPRHDVERQYGQHGAVHRHRDGHLVERNAVEQHFHILDRADRHARFAHVAHDARMVGVVAAVRGQVERYGQSLLSRSEVAAVKRVRLLGGRETGVLTDRPRAHHVHRAVRAAQERSDAGGVVQVFHALEVRGGVGPLHGDVLGGHPRLRFGALLRVAGLSGGAVRICQV